MSLIKTWDVPSTQDLIHKSFMKGVSKDPGMIRQVFHKETESNERDTKRIQEIDFEKLAQRKVQGQASAQRNMAEGYYKEIKRNTISYTAKIAGEAYLGLKAKKLAQDVTSVATGIVNKIELDMRNFIGMGVNSSYTDNGGFTIDTTVGDGLSLFNTAHTLKHSNQTYSNILSGAPSLSEDALESAEDYFAYNVMDNYGKRISMKPNAIITADKATMKNRVYRLLNSESQGVIGGNANANAGVKNAYKNRDWKHLVVEFDVDALDVTDSSKSYWWFLASIGGAPETSFQAYYVSWLSPMVAPAEVDQDRWILSYTARAMYGIGAVSGKGILLSQATS